MSRLTPSQVEKAKRAIQVLSDLDLSEENSVTNPSPPTNSSNQATDEVLAAADRCLSIFSKLNHDPTKSKLKRKAKEEVSSLFAKKSKKGQSSKCIWKHKFICLAYHNQSRIPTTDVDKDDLLRAGLGEKEIEFHNLDIDADEFRDLLYQHFPSLKYGGGFEFFKCGANSRNLEKLSSTTLSSPAVLKSRVGSTRTYIRPLQTDLDMSAVFDLPDGPKEKCLNCGDYFSLGVLASHVSSCISEQATEDKKPIVDLTVKASSESDSDDFGFDFPPLDVGSSNDDILLCHDERIEQEMMDAAITQSMQQSNAATSTEDKAVEDDFEDSNPLMSAIKSLRKNVDEDDTMRIEVRREFLLKDALREAHKKKFSPCRNMKVLFVGEGAIDQGGPKREFFRLLAVAVSQTYFIGRDECKPRFFTNNILAVQVLKKSTNFIINCLLHLQDRDFYYLGVFFVLSVIYGGSGFPFMANAVFEYLCGDSFHASILAEDIPDLTLRFIVEQLNRAENDDDVRVCLSMDEGLELLTATGFRKSIHQLTCDDCPNIINALLHYHLISKVKAESDQFKDGLKTFGFFELVKKNPDMWRPFFVLSDSKLTPETIIDLFNIEYSLTGSWLRPAEEQAYIFFVDFLDECDDGASGCQLAEVLVFFSGSDVIPPLGFEQRPTLSFLHGSIAKFPTASTCDIHLHIPAIYTKYEDFKEAMIIALKSNDGFGGV